MIYLEEILKLLEGITDETPINKGILCTLIECAIAKANEKLSEGM